MRKLYPLISLLFITTLLFLFANSIVAVCFLVISIFVYILVKLFKIDTSWESNSFVLKIIILIFAVLVPIAVLSKAENEKFHNETLTNMIKSAGLGIGLLIAWRIKKN